MNASAASVTDQATNEIIAAAKKKLRSIETKARGAAVDAARSADEFVHENAWQMIAYGVLFGFFLGALAARKK